MSEPRAKLVRKIESGKEWYFDKYELECIECRKHYLRGRYDSRTCPYCPSCKRKRDRIRTKENNEKKQKELYTAIRNKAIDDFTEKVKEIYAFTILEEKKLNEIAEQLKAGDTN